MKRSSKELKRLARQALIGNYGNFAVVYLIYFIITFTVQMIPTMFADNTSRSGLIITQLITVILSIIVSVLAAGLQKTALNITRNEPVRIGDLFFAFGHHPDKYIIIIFLSALIAVAFQIPTIILIVLFATTTTFTDTFVFICMVVLIMLIMLSLSLIVIISYSLSLILLIENPEMGAIEAMQTSAQLMRGNKGRYFYLSLSFLGMELLALCTFGIAYFWVTPYMTTTIIQFYLEVTGELDDYPRETDYTEYPEPNYWT